MQIRRRWRHGNFHESCTDRSSFVISRMVAVLAQSSEVTGGFLQYGAIGLVALLALIAVKVMYQAQVRAFDHERARAERLEDELRKLNEYMAREVIPTLIKATGVIGKVLDERKDV